MSQRSRRAARTMGLLTTILVVACSPDSEDDRKRADLALHANGWETDGEVPEGWFRHRQDGYQRHATQKWKPNVPLNVLSHLQRAERDVHYSLTNKVLADDAWDHHFAHANSLNDTRDFTLLRLIQFPLAHPESPVIPQSVRDKVKTTILGFKYWISDGTPTGLVDNTVYWTENHQLIYHTLEHLAGQLYPDEQFGHSGMTGESHKQRSKAMLLDWMGRKARFGFDEWHSNVYYEEDIAALVTLVEHADDEELATRAAMLLDLLLFDIATHQQVGAFGVTHGRSYKKDKMTSRDEDTFDLTKLAFDTTRLGYQREESLGAVLLAGAKRYRYPKAIWKIARHRGEHVDRERMGIRVHEGGEFDPFVQAPHGYSYADPNDLMVWWNAGAFTAYPVTPLTLNSLEALGLWDSEQFVALQPFRPYLEDPIAAMYVAWQLGAVANSNYLGEVNTYTWRSPDAMLSSAIDHRKGLASVSAHSWQATLDPDAIVFTNHPFLPLQPGEWDDDPEAFGGYWNGEASMPRSAQLENVAIHIYAPQSYPSYPPPLDLFTHEPYTHAYFPKDHFCQVVQQGSWTFGKKAGTYIALYSFRPASYKVYDPAVYSTHGMTEPFDLVAEGGADNVWIVEVGNRKDWGEFGRFRDSISSASLQVTNLGPDSSTGLSRGFEVVYESPSRGRMEFSWEGPFLVDDQVVETSEFPRYDNPWCHVEFGSDVYDIQYNQTAGASCRAELDFPSGTRTLHCTH